MKLVLARSLFHRMGIIETCRNIEIYSDMMEKHVLGAVDPFLKKEPPKKKHVISLGGAGCRILKPIGIKKLKVADVAVGSSTGVAPSQWRNFQRKFQIQFCPSPSISIDLCQRQSVMQLCKGIVAKSWGMKVFQD